MFLLAATVLIAASTQPAMAQMQLIVVPYLLPSCWTLANFTYPIIGGRTPADLVAAAYDQVVSVAVATDASATPSGLAQSCYFNADHGLSYWFVNGSTITHSMFCNAGCLPTCSASASAPFDSSSSSVASCADDMHSLVPAGSAPSPFSLRNDPYGRFIVQDTFAQDDLSCSKPPVSSVLVRVYDSCTQIATTNASETVYAISTVNTTSVVQNVCTDSTCTNCTSSSTIKAWSLSASPCDVGTSITRGFYFSGNVPKRIDNSTKASGSAPAKPPAATKGESTSQSDTSQAAMAGSPFSNATIIVFVIVGLILFGVGAVYLYSNRKKLAESSAHRMSVRKSQFDSKRQSFLPTLARTMSRRTVIRPSAGPASTLGLRSPSSDFLLDPNCISPQSSPSSPAVEKAPAQIDASDRRNSFLPTLAKTLSRKLTTSRKPNSETAATNAPKPIDVEKSIQITDSSDAPEIISPPSAAARRFGTLVHDNNMNVIKSNSAPNKDTYRPASYIQMYSTATQGYSATGSVDGATRAPPGLTPQESHRFATSTAARHGLQVHVSLVNHEPNQPKDMKLCIGDKLVIESPWTDGRAAAFNLTTGGRGEIPIIAVAEQDDVSSAGFSTLMRGVGVKLSPVLESAQPNTSDIKP